MLTYQDKQKIKELYYFDRYKKPSLGRLYGVSRQRIEEIIHEEINVTYAGETDCQLCETGENALPYYIDGNEENKDPQNVIRLCIVDRKKIEHIQLNKKMKKLRLQSL